MSGRTKWADIKAARFPAPADQAEIAARADAMAKEIPFAELRHARKLSQQTLAAALGTGQAAVSKLERRTDMYVSTLRGIIEAMGGHLEIVARFPDGDVKISRFGGEGRRQHATDVVPAPTVAPARKAAFKRPGGAKKRGVVRRGDLPSTPRRREGR